jgi:hypothetical protein
MIEVLLAVEGFTEDTAVPADVTGITVVTALVVL